MSEIAIKVENLSKMYHIGARREQYSTLRSALVSGLKKLVTRGANPDYENNTLWALKDVSFEVHHGDVVGIIGRNGAGKSTLLKVLAHITEPTQGRVSLYGRVGSLLEVGTGFHPELTGRDNIYLNGAILGMKRFEIRQKFEEIVDFAEIEKFLDTPVKHYSSGMFVRLAFAVAAHLDPEILVVDEVLAVGDAAFQKKCLGKMNDVACKGRTVLFVSHNMEAVRQLCIKGFLLENGNITYQDTIFNVIDRYLYEETVETQNRGKKEFDRKYFKYIKSIELVNSKSVITNTFFLGENMKIALRLGEMNQIKGARVGISFNTLEGQRIFVFDTDMKSNLAITSFSSDDYCSLYVKHLPLLPGRYSLDIIIATHYAGRIEIIKDAIQFNVLTDDIFQNSYFLSNSYGLVYHFEADWNIKNINE